MSADTTVVIAAYRWNGSELAYTAGVVQSADDFLGDSDDAFVFQKVAMIFLERPHVWFSGKGGLSRAKQFANLLAEDFRENSILEYEQRPMFEIGAGRIYALSRKGHRRSLSNPEGSSSFKKPDTTKRYCWAYRA